jgi:hypothetical protein
MLGDPGLIHGEDRTRLKLTVPGMAHFAGTGPSGATCGGCVHWDKRDERSLIGKHKPRRCDKFRQLMQGMDGAPIPASTPACKYYAGAVR